MYCKNCGNKLNKEDKFCSQCGTKVEAEEPLFPSGPEEPEQVHAEKKEKTDFHITGFDWDLEGFPSKEFHKTENPDFNWEPIRENRSEEREELEDFTEDDLFLSTQEPVPGGKADEFKMSWEKTARIYRPADEKTEKLGMNAYETVVPASSLDKQNPADKPEKQLPEKDDEYKYDKVTAERTMAEGIAAAQKASDSKIDKFYTFNKKNEEFQALLDQEYERLKKRIREEDEAEKILEEKARRLEKARNDWQPDKLEGDASIEGYEDEVKLSTKPGKISEEEEPVSKEETGDDEEALEHVNDEAEHKEEKKEAELKNEAEKNEKKQEVEEIEQELTPEKENEEKSESEKANIEEELSEGTLKESEDKGKNPGHESLKGALEVNAENKNPETQEEAEENIENKDSEEDKTLKVAGKQEAVGDEHKDIGETKGEPEKKAEYIPVIASEPVRKSDQETEIKERGKPEDEEVLDERILLAGKKVEAADNTPGQGLAKEESRKLHYKDIFEDDSDVGYQEEKPKKSHRGLIIFLDIIIVILLIMTILSAIMYFKPESKAADYIRGGLDKVLELTDKGKHNDLPEVEPGMEKSLVEEAITSLSGYKNVKSFNYDSNLRMVGTSEYPIEGAGKADTIEDNDENTEDIIKAAAAYIDSLYERKNTGSDDVLNLIEKDSPLYTQVEALTGGNEETLVSDLTFGEIENDGDNYFVIMKLTEQSGGPDGEENVSTRLIHFTKDSDRFLAAEVGIIE
jgi:hypothetical protein